MGIAAGIAAPVLVPLPASAGYAFSHNLQTVKAELFLRVHLLTLAALFNHRFKKELKKRKVSLEEYTTSGEMLLIALCTAIAALRASAIAQYVGLGF